MSERMTDERLAELEERVEPRHAQELLYAMQEERRSLRELEDRVKSGFQGGCYCCESVATKNIELEAEVARLQAERSKWWQRAVDLGAAAEAAESKLRAAGEIEKEMRLRDSECLKHNAPAPRPNYWADELEALLKEQSDE